MSDPRGVAPRKARARRDVPRWHACCFLFSTTFPSSTESFSYCSSLHPCPRASSRQVRSFRIRPACRIRRRSSARCRPHRQARPWRTTPEFTVTPTDINVGDDLYVIWIDGVPATHQFISGADPADDDSALRRTARRSRVQTSFSPTCYQVNRALPTHQIMAAISDSPFCRTELADHASSGMPPDPGGLDLGAELHGGVAMRPAWHLLLACAVAAACAGAREVVERAASTAAPAAAASYSRCSNDAQCATRRLRRRDLRTAREQFRVAAGRGNFAGGHRPAGGADRADRRRSAMAVTGAAQDQRQHSRSRRRSTSDRHPFSVDRERPPGGPVSDPGTTGS